MNTRILLVAAAGAALALAACSSTDEEPVAAEVDPTTAEATTPEVEPMAAEPTTVTLAASDFAFDLPAEVEAGLTTFEMPNEGQEAHHAQLVRVTEDGNLDDALAALGEEDLDTVFQHVTLAGGVGVVPPGGSAAATVNLAPGDHAFLCALESPDGTPHVARGMVSTFTVAGEAPADPPQVETVGEVTLNDFAFGVPDDLDGTVAVTNDGEQPHEMLLIQLGEGVPLEEALASLEGPPPSDGPPPAVPAGGMQAIMPGDTGYVDLSTLESGTYGLVCFIPDRATGRPHLELGMVAQIQVE